MCGRMGRDTGAPVVCRASFWQHGIVQSSQRVWRLFLSVSVSVTSLEGLERSTYVFVHNGIATDPVVPK